MVTMTVTETLQKRLARRVRELRRKLGLTLKVAAERAALHWRHWQKIEAGEANVTLDTLRRLGEVLGVDGSDLLVG